MAAKKDTSHTSNDIEQLEAKIDAMMDVAVNAQTDEDQTKEVVESNAIASAPELPQELKVTSRKAKSSATKQVEEDAVADDVAVAPIELDTPESDAAIDDIIAQEADQVLAAEDAGIRAARNDAEESYEPAAESHGHPFFWFLIVLIVVIAFLTFYVLTSPGLELQLPFSA